jgi:3-hydroxyisobutyrate dehydrogenase-like beta-hydroxyacid dehydrogenase
MKVGFIGLGQMGAGIAANLITAGHEVTVYNRSIEKTEPLVARGARAARVVADACRGEVVMTMLADDGALEQIVFDDGGVLAILPKGAVHVSLSTISVALCERLAAAHAVAAQRFVAAPVFGRPQAAAAAQLYIVAAGAADALATSQPLFDAIGQRTFTLGESPPAAALVKIGGNFLIASAIEAMGEAMALVAKAGVDRNRFVEILTSTLFNAPVYRGYGALIAAQQFEPAGFAAPLGLKDVRLALAAGESLRVPLPLASLLRDRLIELLARGGEKQDWSAIARLAAEDAGL